MYPIVTTYDELLYYWGRPNDKIPPLDTGEGASAAHLADEAGDPGFSAEALPGDTDK
jgi:hypothetical protein